MKRRKSFKKAVFVCISIAPHLFCQINLGMLLFVGRPTWACNPITIKFIASRAHHQYILQVWRLIYAYTINMYECIALSLSHPLSIGLSCSQSFGRITTQYACACVGENTNVAFLAWNVNDCLALFLLSLSLLLQSSYIYLFIGKYRKRLYLTLYWMLFIPFDVVIHG